MVAKGKVGALAFAVSLALGAAAANAGSTVNWRGDYPKRPSAIIGGDANAIIGGDANAIIGGDFRKAKRPSAIIGGDANAIIGGDANAIIGGDANAIIGGDFRKAKRPSAIIGGDANAIIGGDANAIIGGDLLGLLQSGLLIYGPVRVVDASRALISVLGQTYHLSKDRIGDLGLATRVSSGAPLAGVFGHRTNKGTFKSTRLVFAGTQYVPGSTRVVVTGTVTAVDSSVAQLQIGKLLVDYSGLLAASPLDVAVGDVVSIGGMHFADDVPLQAAAIIRR